MEELEVKTWLIAAQKEEWGTYESLRPRIFAWIFRIAFRILRNEAEAEEAAATALVKLYMKRAEFDPNKSAKAYVVSTAERLCWDIVRRQKSQPVDSLDDNHLGPFLPSSSPTQFDLALTNELLAALEYAAGKMVPGDMELLLQSALDLTSGPRSSSDHARLYRARHRLRKLLEATFAVSPKPAASDRELATPSNRDPGRVRVDSGSRLQSRGKRTYFVKKIFFATDRRPADPTCGGLRFFDNDRDPNRNLYFGLCEVSIPETHKVGALEGPSICKLEFSRDPKKHVVLLKLRSQRPATFFRGRC